MEPPADLAPPAVEAEGGAVPQGVRAEAVRPHCPRRIPRRPGAALRDQPLLSREKRRSPYVRCSTRASRTTTSWGQRSRTRSGPTAFSWQRSWTSVVRSDLGARHRRWSRPGPSTSASPNRGAGGAPTAAACPTGPRIAAAGSSSFADIFSRPMDESSDDDEERRRAALHGNQGPRFNVI